MAEERAFLISALKRVIANGDISRDELTSAISDPQSLGRADKLAWEALSHWADDDDVRAKDPSYESFRRDQLEERLADLQALEAGFLEEEVRRGEHLARHIPAWGCLTAIATIATAAWLLLR